MDLDKDQDLAMGWLLLCFINIMYAKVIRVQFFSSWADNRF